MTFNDPDYIQIGGQVPVQLPRIGQSVHYVSYGTPGGEYKSVCRAAVITEIGAWIDVSFEYLTTQTVRRVVQEWREHYVGLCVLNPTGEFFNRNVKPEMGRDDEKTSFCTGLVYEGGTWHFPYKKLACELCEDVPEWYDMEKCPRCGAKASK